MADDARQGLPHAGNEVIIKPCDTDAERLGRAYVNWRSWRESYAGIVDATYLEERSLEGCERRALEQEFDVLVAKAGERVVGFTGYGACRDDDMSDAGEVYSIYLLREWQGVGIGHRLLSTAMEALRGAGHARVAVWVFARNDKAIGFYGRHGFVADGTEKVIECGVPAMAIRMVRPF